MFDSERSVALQRVRARRPLFGPSVAVIIAARNAAATIRDTLDSLIAQSFADWEAVIVNDGSTDETGAIAECYARVEPRLKVLHATHGGVSAARNAGIGATNAPWIMILDADDQLQPWHLSGMISTGRDDASAEVVYADWRIIGAEGQEGMREKVQYHGPPIRQLSRSVNVLVHGLMFRRDLLERTGLFQPGLPIAEDWDLWMRMARVGARFRPAHPDVVARYSMRADSACSNTAVMIERLEQVAHFAASDDARINAREAVPAFGPGELDAHCIHNAFWSAARHAGQGRDPLEILRGMKTRSGAPVSEIQMQWTIFLSLLQALANPRPDWPALWPGLRPRIAAMLDHVAPWTRVPFLTERTLKGVEQLAIEQIDPLTLAAGETRQVGTWALARVDLAAPQMPQLPSGTERVRLRIDRNGAALGEVIVVPDRLSSAERFAPVADSFRDAPDLVAKDAGVPDPAEMPAASEQLAGWQGTAEDAEAIADALFGRGGAHRPAAGLKVLLLAAGNGHLAEALAAAGAEVHATDSDPTARRALSLRFLRNRAVRVCGLDPLRDTLDGPYDLIVLPRGLAGLRVDETPAILIDRLWSVLAPDGRLALLAPERPEGEDQPTADDIRLLLRDRLDLLPAQVQSEAGQLLVADRARQGEAAGARLRLTAPAAPFRADAIPVLMYHRVATDPLPELRQYAVSPEEFAAQMQCLAAMGATALTLDAFEAAIWQGAPLPERAVLITFDDAYVDTMTEAIPVMQQAGMTATIFVPTAHVGGTAAWDAAYGPAAPLMDWDQLREAQRLGFSLAAHSHNHFPLAALSPGAAGFELEHPRGLLQRHLGIETRALAYPYGNHDQALEWEVFGAGYRLAFTTESRRYVRTDKVMAIPRLDIARGLTLDRFARMVTG